MKVIATLRAIIKQRKAIQSPWFSSRGVRMCHAGKNTNIVEMIIVLRIALDAVAPI